MNTDTAEQDVQFAELETLASKGEIAVREPRSNGAMPITEPSTPPPAISRNDVAALAGAIAKVMQAIGMVEKTGEHQYFKYSYTTMNDMLKKLTPLMAENGIAIIQDEINRHFVEGNYVAASYEFTILHSSGAIWPHRPRFTGLSLAKSEKGGFDPACLNKCAIAARKYFLLSLFQIPAGDVDDADQGDNDHSAPPKQAARAKAPNPSQSTTPPKHQKPQMIAAEGSRAGWVQSFNTAIAGCENVAELSAWKNLNQKALDDIKEHAPKLFSDIDANFKAIASKFAPSKPEKPVADFDLESPSTWADNPDALLKAVEAKCKTYSDQPDPGGLGDWFYQEIEAHLVDAGMMVPDLDKIAEIYQRHLKRAKGGS
jgi:hypothetical protein